MTRLIENEEIPPGWRLTYTEDAKYPYKVTTPDQVHTYADTSKKVVIDIAWNRWSKVSCISRWDYLGMSAAQDQVVTARELLNRVMPAVLDYNSTSGDLDPVLWLDDANVFLQESK